MELKMRSLALIVLVVILSHSTESFFFNQILRRQSGPPPPPPASPPPVRGRVLGTRPDAPIGASFQLIHRPTDTNQLTEGDKNFQVPSSLCLACGNFPWTPVTGKEISGSVQPVAAGSSTGGIQQPIAGEKPATRPNTFVFNNQEFPVHQHLQVTKEPGNTVVINALPPDEDPQGSRKPFSFAFASAGNTVTNGNTVKSGNTVTSGSSTSQGQRSPADQAPPPKSFGGPIMIPYEPTKQSSALGEVPRQPSASSLTPGYAKPPPLPKPRPSPGLYGSNTPPLATGPTNQYPKSVLPPNHPQNLAPITVGTILAAQHSSSSGYQIQPANLVYQEHTSNYQPHYFVPLPSRPVSGPAPQASAPHSFKVPILSNNAGPSGTVLLNQVPLHSVAGYNPKFAPSFVPPGVYAFPVPPQQQPPISFFQPQPIPAQPQLIPAQRQPKPGYSGQLFGAYESNQFRVPEQQVQHGSSQITFEEAEPVKGQRPEYGIDQVKGQRPEYGIDQVKGQQSQYGIDIRTPLAQRPIPPARPYSPPKASASSAPSPPPQTEKDAPQQVSPTYIPPKVTGGQLYTSYTGNDQVQTNDLDDPKSPTRDEGQGTLDFMQSQKSQVEVAPEQKPTQDYADTGSSTVSQRHKPITIPNLLRIQQAYRFLDESPSFESERYRNRLVGTQAVLRGEEVGQASIATQTQTEGKRKEPEPTPTTTLPTTHAPPTTFPTKVTTQESKATLYEIDDKRPNEGKYEEYEVVPATQYDITHLFRNGVKGHEEKPPQQQQQPQIKFKPVPVPVPVSESDVANSKAPLFVIDPLSSNNQESYGFDRGQGQGQRGQTQGQSQSQYNIQYSPQSSYEEKQNLYANYNRPLFYDPLPPSVVSALQHAQTTSLLTHQHLGSSPPRENTIYVNSVPVIDDEDAPPPPHHKRILKPIAFDLNSGKQIQLQSNTDPAELLSLQTVLDADAEEQRKTMIIPKYTLQEAGSRPFLTSDLPTSAPDQSTVNCQNSPQWTAPPRTESPLPQDPIEYQSHVTGFQNQLTGFQSHVTGIQSHVTGIQNQVTGFPSHVTESADINEEDLGHKQFVVYYPSQGGSYWINQDGFMEPATAPESSDKELIVGQEVELPVTTTTTSTTTTTHAPVEFKESSSSKTYPAKPVLKWSKIVKPKVKVEPVPEPVPFSGTKQSRMGTEDPVTEPTQQKMSQDFDINPRSEQLVFDKDESGEETKDVESTRTPYISTSRDGGIVYETIATGPTTGVECITESTTTETTDNYDSTTLATTTSATSKPSTTTTSTQTVKRTFSPRITDEIKRNRGGNRFPTGRPTVSTIRRTTEDSGSAVSASVLVPVYRSPQQSLSSILAQTLKSFETSDSTEHFTGSSSSTESLNSAQSFPTVEDDEADDLQGQNILEVPTARKVGSTGLSVNSYTVQKAENKTTTPRIVFSSQIIPTVVPTAGGSLPGQSTKVVKTVRVRQRMRPAYFSNLAQQQRLRMSTGSSRVRVMTRAGASDYVRSHPESALPEGETLGEEEQKEVKEALIDIKRVSNS